MTGLDFSETAIELARGNARDAGADAAFDVGDAITLPYADASFDLVVDNHLLHCIVDAPDRARTLASVHRVLAPGGRLWSETMSREGVFDAARFHADPLTGIAANHSRIWVTRDELAAEVTAAGLAIESMKLRPQEDGVDIVTIARRDATMRHG